MKISKIHKISKNPLILGFLILAIITAPFIGLEAKAKTLSASYTQDELFRAIYFLEGDLVNQIPALSQIKDYLPAHNKTQAEIQTEGAIMNEISNIDPSFKSRLFNAVSSNDHYTISSTLKEGSDLQLLATSKVLRNAGNLDIPDISHFDLSNSDQRSQAINTLMEFYGTQDNFPQEYGLKACALLALAVAVAVYLFIYLWGADAAQNPDSLYSLISNDKNLSHEQLVQQLVSLN